MDHEEAVRERVTERYLLNELDPNLRDQFEEHLFGCQECALDVRAAAMFVEQSKTVMSEPPQAAAVRVPVVVPVKPAGFGWLRPALAVPVLAGLLAVILYQNMVTYPQLKQAASSPQVLPWASINVSTRGTNAPPVTVAPGKGFLLFVRIPPEKSYSRYTADLYNPAGKLEWSLAIPATSAEDTWPVQVPPANRDSGIYTLRVHGVTGSGESVEVGFPTKFELQVQK
jgi:anti-sigma factor RsiW